MPLPLFKNSYKIKGLEIRNEEVGCLDKPVLFAISSGQNLGESLIFHLKIGNYYFDCYLRKVNGTFCNLRCAGKKCPARHKLKVNEKYIIRIKDYFKLKDGRSRDKFDIDRTIPELRLLQNWCVVGTLIKQFYCQTLQPKIVEMDDASEDENNEE